MYLMHNLSPMTFDKNDFKVSTSFIERIKIIDKKLIKKKITLGKMIIMMI